MNKFKRLSHLSVSLPKRTGPVINKDGEMELIVVFQSEALRVSVNSSDFDEAYVLTLFASCLYDGAASPAGVHWSEEINSIAECLEEDYANQFDASQIQGKIEQILGDWVNTGTLDQVMTRINTAISCTPDISKPHHYYPLLIEAIEDFNSGTFSVTLAIIFD